MNAESLLHKEVESIDQKNCSEANQLETHWQQNDLLIHLSNEM